MRKRIVSSVAVVAVLIAVTYSLPEWDVWALRLVDLVSSSYDRDFYSKNYHVGGDAIYIVDQADGARYPVKRSFRDGFEDVSHVRELIGLERGWTSVTLLSPSAPTISDYNRLKTGILEGTHDFLDNRVEPSTEQHHSGVRSLKTLAVTRTSSMVCTKASLETMLLHFVKGDDVWYSGWYYLDGPSDFITLMDLETTFARGYPGIRLRVNGGCVDAELKYPPKPVYRQSGSRRREFPVRRWVHLRSRFGLSAAKDGVVQVWQDGELIIDERGQTLPFSEAVYNDLEIGLTAHSGRSGPAILYVDDVEISADPIGPSVQSRPSHAAGGIPAEPVGPPDGVPRRSIPRSGALRR